MDSARLAHGRARPGVTLRLIALPLRQAETANRTEEKKDGHQLVHSQRRINTASRRLLSDPVPQDICFEPTHLSREAQIVETALESSRFNETTAFGTVTPHDPPCVRGRRVPIEQAREAFARAERDGMRGKIVLQIARG